MSMEGDDNTDAILREYAMTTLVRRSVNPFC